MKIVNIGSIKNAVASKFLNQQSDATFSVIFQQWRSRRDRLFVRVLHDIIVFMSHLRAAQTRFPKRLHRPQARAARQLQGMWCGPGGEATSGWGQNATGQSGRTQDGGVGDARGRPRLSHRTPWQCGIGRSRQCWIVIAEHAGRSRPSTCGHHRAKGVRVEAAHVVLHGWGRKRAVCVVVPYESGAIAQVVGESAHRGGGVALGESRRVGRARRAVLLLLEMIGRRPEEIRRGRRTRRSRCCSC